jgi:anti-sigma factor RsiW
MECRDVREVADSFLAEELLTETNHEILRHLETCPVCRADVTARRALREGVRRAFHGAPGLDTSPEFVEQLRTRLQKTAHQEPARRGIRFHGWWALAATVLLAVALGVAYRGRGWIAAGDTLARAAVGDHRNCALQFRLTEKPVSLEEAARRYGAAYGVLDKVPANEVMTAVGPARVLERHACVYGGRRFAHIVFEYRGERVSLMMTAADEVGSSASTRVDGMNVVSFQAGRQLVFIAGDVPAADLTMLADTVAGPLGRELAGA